MSYSILNVTGRFSGTVCYSDGTSSGFHAGIADDIAFSADADSAVALDSLNYNNLVSGSGPTADGVVIGAPFIHGFVSTTIGDVGSDSGTKTVNDFVAHLSLTIAFSDNTVQVYSATVERVSGVLTTVNHTESEVDRVAGASNSSAFASTLEAMFEQVFINASVTIG